MFPASGYDIGSSFTSWARAALILSIYIGGMFLQSGFVIGSSFTGISWARAALVLSIYNEWVHLSKQAGRWQSSIEY